MRSTPEAHPAAGSGNGTIAFGRIVCGVDGSRSAEVAVEQAIALSGPGGTVRFVCVREEAGAGATHRSTISSERAKTVLERALEAARAAGIDATAETLSGHNPASALNEAASEADLLAVASHGGTRAGGIALGSVASTAVHRAPVPVLVARRPPPGVGFRERILVASDGSADAQRAVALAVRIARGRRASVYLLNVDPAPHGERHRLAVDAVDLTAELGHEPVVLRLSGNADERIVEAARTHAVALLAVGSRGLSGVRALGSVSERVAHRAPCSVLVARQH